MPSPFLRRLAGLAAWGSEQKWVFLAGSMQPEKERFLNLKSLPARLTTEHAAWILGFAAHEIPILVAKGLLRPLGHPAHNGQKYFLAATLEDI